MAESGPGAGRGCPSGWWYGLAVVVATATVVVTGIVGYGRAVDLIDRVEGFQHFGGSGSSVSVTEPGEYAVYQEWVERGGGNPYATGAPVAEPTITVTARDGTQVPVRPSSVSYGWGRQQAEAVGTFDLTQPGEYRIDATGVEGRLAFGEAIPGSPLYGMGGPLLVAAAIVLACLVGALVVAKRRRDWRRGPAEPRPSPGGGDGGSGRARAGAVVVVIALVLVGGAVALAAGRDGDSSPETVGTQGPSEVVPGEPRTTADCTSDEGFETGLCGIDPEELRETNLAYADRIPFSGDDEAVSEIAEEVQAALAPLANVRPAPSPDQVAAALAPVSPDVTVSDTAVRTAGAAFGVAVDGGCVFGSVYDGSIEVFIGGYINDGGCLAEYAH